MKRIAYYVIAMHLLLILWSALWMPSKKIDQKPLQVRTVVYAPPPPPAPVAVMAVKPAVQKVAAVAPKPAPPPPKPAPPPPKPVPPKPKPVASPIKKAAPPPRPVKSAPVVSAELVQQLQESIAKIEQTSHKDSPKKIYPTPNLPILKGVPELKIDEVSEGQESLFVATLIQCLRTALDLPEFGEVKVELVLKRDGSFVKMKVLQSESEKNRRFLEQELKTMTFPAFTGELKNEKEHAFVITFCNS